MQRRSCLYQPHKCEVHAFGVHIDSVYIGPSMTKAEMRKLLGIVIYMSVVHLPGRRDYWSAATRQEFVADAMPLNRFEEILSLLHATDNALIKKKGEPGYDRLHKVRPLLNNLNKNFAKCAEPEHMSVDEHIVPFKGHYNLKVYMEKKTNKWGYKIWGSAGASGYIHKFYVQGDNLVEDLKKRGFHVTCTVRQNRRRQCPTLTKKFEKKGRGSYDYRSAEGVLVCSWYDNKIVNVASNKCSVKPTAEVRRYEKKTKACVNIECPALIKAYNKCMGGVDKCDMMLSLYPIKMKSRKWYRRLIFHMIDLAIANAWHLQKAVKGTSSKYYKFKLAIAECLVQGALEPHPMQRDEMPNLPRDVPSAKHVPNHVRFDGINHLPKQMAKVPKNCKFPNCQRRTRFFCMKCKVYLCIDGKSDCFYNYHLTD
ncbi:piggyBac transposable element-derived protein 3-like [Penaeus indicus]|uniref:piggyBac transposable element-derived protein 3-like n=1 Tax=Penaeus indicus TaxID=29960 RepID=UPI00300CE19A